MSLGNYTCGFCGTLTPRTVAAAFEPTSEYVGRYGPHEVSWMCLVCAGCGRYTLVAEGLFGIDYYPAEGRPRLNVVGVPESIVGDYSEAISCIQVSAHKAATAMARRAVQAVCINLGASANARLFDQIDELHGKGEFTNRLHALAHKVRSFGNAGAHPGKDGLDEVGPEDSQQALGFLEHLLQHVYILGGDEDEEAPPAV